MPETIARLVRFMADLERTATITFGGAVAAMQPALEAASLHRSPTCREPGPI
jgi:hypothetical protein